MTIIQRHALPVLVLFALLAVSGCTALPNPGSTGALESPCGDAADCDSGVCIEWNGAHFCSDVCTVDADCARGYGCADDGTCVPEVVGACHFEGDVCGQGTDPCCDGTVCVAWQDGVPPTCSRACTTYEDCDDADVVDDRDEYLYNFCCVTSIGACALEPYCY